MSSEPPLKSPLTDWHAAHGAKMVDFHGWEMPLIYTKVFDEVATTRQAVGLFDLCHMGRIKITGRSRFDFIEKVFTGNVLKMDDHQVKYGFICTEMGGVLDDVTLYRHPDYLFLVVNASNRVRVLNWLHNHTAGLEDIKIEDVTHSLAMLAVQGPKCDEVMREVTNFPADALKYYGFHMTKICSHVCLISRTGYTGERGYEVYFNSQNAVEVWEQMVEAAKPLNGGPIGLAARDTLRLEAGMPLHGQELTTATTPLQAGLEKFIDFAKGNFYGKARLLESTNSDISKRLVGFEMDCKAIPRTGQPITHNGINIGTVTSGGWSPTLNKAIGMGYVDHGLSRTGSAFHIHARDKYLPAIVVRRPFYKRKKTES